MEENNIEKTIEVLRAKNYWDNDLDIGVVFLSHNEKSSKSVEMRKDVIIVDINEHNEICTIEFLQKDAYDLLSQRIYAHMITKQTSSISIDDIEQILTIV